MLKYAAKILLFFDTAKSFYTKTALIAKFFFFKTALIAKFMVKMTDIMKYSIPKYLKRTTKYANVSYFLLGMRILSSAMSPMNIG